MTPIMNGVIEPPLPSRLRRRQTRRRPETWLEGRMFAPSINVDLENLQKAAEEKPATTKKVAAKGRHSARKAAPKNAKSD
jgi:hypothetical protein